jgi:glycine betaine/choline ABC-type transport system substrate-binding protein
MTSFGVRRQLLLLLLLLSCWAGSVHSTQHRDRIDIGGGGKNRQNIITNLAY